MLALKSGDGVSLSLSTSMDSVDPGSVTCVSRDPHLAGAETALLRIPVDESQPIGVVNPCTSLLQSGCQAVPDVYPGDVGDRVLLLPLQAYWYPIVFGTGDPIIELRPCFAAAYNS